MRVADDRRLVLITRKTCRLSDCSFPSREPFIATPVIVRYNCGCSSLLPPLTSSLKDSSHF